MIEAPLILVFFPLMLVWFVWAILFLANHPGEEIRDVKHRQLLGPGGPDDPFAGTPWND
jgi:hypothetical protein